MIEKVYNNEDGYWCILKEGYYAAGLEGNDKLDIINEYTASNLLKMI